ncbi:MAG TPA: hypothetical protein VE291_11120, partial [Terracidiphilus sp.]|nr:hypothetical protein [Terracidiphilus sp.]
MEWLQPDNKGLRQICGGQFDERTLSIPLIEDKERGLTGPNDGCPRSEQREVACCVGYRVRSQ